MVQFLAPIHAQLALLPTVKLVLLTPQNVPPVLIQTTSLLQQLAHHVLIPPIVSLALVPEPPNVPRAPLENTWYLVPAQPPAQLENTHLLATMSAQLVLILDAILALQLELVCALDAPPIISTQALS